MAPFLLPFHSFHSLTSHSYGTHTEVPLSCNILRQLFPGTISVLFEFLAKAQTICEFENDIEILPRFPNRFHNLVAPLDVSVGVSH